MKVLYISSFITGMLGIIIALALAGVESVLDAWWSLGINFQRWHARSVPAWIYFKENRKD